MKGIAADTLKIFAPGADSPSEVDYFIGELGESKNDPFLVLVPFLFSRGATNVDISQLFSQSPTEPGIIDIGPILSPLVDHAKKIFIRACLPQLFEVIGLNLDEPQTKTLTGTPGTGKTLFLIYSDFRLAKVVLQLRSTKFNYLITPHMNGPMEVIGITWLIQSNQRILIAIARRLSLLFPRG